MLLDGALEAGMVTRVGGAPATTCRGGGYAGVPWVDHALGLDVLVVDENAVNREVAVAMLEDAVARSPSVEDGRTAVKPAHSPDASTRS